MLSLRCRMFLFVLRHRHLLHLKWRKETALDWEKDLATVRKNAEKTCRMFGGLPKGIAVHLRQEPTEAPQ